MDLPFVIFSHKPTSHTSDSQLLYIYTYLSHTGLRTTKKPHPILLQSCSLKLLWKFGLTTLIFLHFITPDLSIPTNHLSAWIDEPCNINASVRNLMLHISLRSTMGLTGSIRNFVIISTSKCDFFGLIMLQGVKVYVLTVNDSLIIKEIKFYDLSLNFYGFEFNGNFVKKL